jgi:2'-5' RNA ligase
MNERIRAFVAVLLSEEVRASLAREVDRLRSVAPRLTWVSPDNLHLTLKFLGHVSSETVARAEDGLAEAVAGQPPLTLVFAGLGAFPSVERPRVIWAGLVEGGESLVTLQARVEAVLALKAIPKEDRRFHPHLTIGRAKDPRQARPLVTALRARATAPFGRQHVSAIHLMRSDLHPQGARYTVLRAFPLAPVTD